LSPPDGNGASYSDVHIMRKGISFVLEDWVTGCISTRPPEAARFSTTRSTVPRPEPRKRAPLAPTLYAPTTKTMIPITVTATTPLLLLFRAAITLATGFPHTSMGLLRINRSFLILHRATLEGGVTVGRRDAYDRQDGVGRFGKQLICIETGPRE